MPFILEKAAYWRKLSWANRGGGGLPHRLLWIRHFAYTVFTARDVVRTASEVTYIVSGGALNSTHSLTVRTARTSYSLGRVCVWHIIVLLRWAAMMHRFSHRPDGCACSTMLAVHVTASGNLSLSLSLSLSLWRVCLLLCSIVRNNVFNHRCYINGRWSNWVLCVGGWGALAWA